MSPDAKTLAELLKVRLSKLIRPQLPQFAYQPGRDLYNALARVQVWIENFKRCYGRETVANSLKGIGRKFCQGGGIFDKSY